MDETNFFTLRQGETENQYIWRCGRARESGLIQKNWEDMAKCMNNGLRHGQPPYTESAYRKKYSTAKAFYDEIFSKPTSVSNEIKALTLERQQTEKERVKIRDERNELRRILREQARREEFHEQFVRSINEYVEPYAPSFYPASSFGDETDLIVMLTDVHYGMSYHGVYNEYSPEIAQHRMKVYSEKVAQIAKRHKSKNCYMFLSELISGYIHTSLRIENNQDVIDQFLGVTSCISQFILSLVPFFDDIYVYMAPGNHGRMMPDKKESIDHENMDNLIIPMIKAKLQNYDHVHFGENDIDHSIVKFNVRGYSVFGVHGDKDSPDSVVDHLTLMLGCRPDVVLMGHRHTNAVTTCYDTKVIQSGSLSGMDQFCMDHRLKNRAEQSVVVINNGVDCIYDVNFE